MRLPAHAAPALPLSSDPREPVYEVFESPIACSQAFRFPQYPSRPGLIRGSGAVLAGSNKTLRSREHRALIAVLRASRAEVQLTQRQLAERLRWPKSTYAAVESGERRLDVVEFRHVANALGVDPEVLFARFNRW